MMRTTRLMLASALLLYASEAFSITPATEVFLAAVGRGQGSCPSGVCSQWRTTVWVTVPGTTAASVEMAFLKQGQANTSPAIAKVTVPGGASQQFTDVFQDTFHLDGVFGAMRLRANVPILVNARIFDSNVTTNKGTGTAGQDMPGIPFESAIVPGKSADLAGLAADSAGVWRSNFGLVEVMGQNCTVSAAKVDSGGTILATKAYQLLPFEAMQASLNDIGGAPGANQRVRLTVISGTGAVIGLGALLDNKTGDATTVDQPHGTLVSPLDMVGTWSGQFWDGTFEFGGTVSVVVTVDVPSRTCQATLTVTAQWPSHPAGWPPVQHFTGSLTPQGMNVSAASDPLLGPYTFNLNPNGSMVGTFPNKAVANPPFSSGLLFGYTDGKQATIAYFLNYIPLYGGQEAFYVYLTKH